jgi:hypothetical protein
MYAKIENSQVIQLGLPRVGVLKDGRTISGYNLLDEETLKSEGWISDYVEPIDINIIKQNKIQEMNSLCGYKIINEFYSTCLGENKRFDCELIDQSNIMGLVAKAQIILSNPLLEDKSLDWKASGELICYPFTIEQVVQLGMDLYNHKASLIKKFELLRVYINSLATIDEVNVVTWNTEIV